MKIVGCFIEGVLGLTLAGMALGLLAVVGMGLLQLFRVCRRVWRGEKIEDI